MIRRNKKICKENVIKFLVSNKIDLKDKRVISFDEGKNISEILLCFLKLVLKMILIIMSFLKKYFVYLNKNYLSKDNQLHGINLNSMILKQHENKTDCC